MKTSGVLLLTAMLVFTMVAPAAAHHGGHGAVTTAATPAVTYASAPYPPAPAYALPVYAAPPPPRAPSYWYYCPSASRYYPYVSACPAGWVTVVPR